MTKKIQFCPGCGTRLGTHGPMSYRAIVCPHCGGQYYVKRMANLRKREKRIVNFPKEINRQLRRIVGLSLENDDVEYIDFKKFANGELRDG
jgi:hypothetical protein